MQRESALSVALFTDLYELTMAEAYFQEGFEGEAVFTLFVRKLPDERNYLLAAGLDRVLSYLEYLSFTKADIDYLMSLERFSDSFLARLQRFRFTGEVHAVAEGTTLFANEPILEIVAPLPEAQIAETYVMNQVHLATVLASKAARLVQAARGRPVIDFGARRMHGIDAAVEGARAFHIAGIAGTSDLLAGATYDLPVYGTMAHSYIQAHDSEEAAFRSFAAKFPDTTLLVDTYDTLAGVDRVIRLSRVLADDFRVNAVRLDSGDLADLAKETRRRLDAAGLKQVKIFASGGLDEYEIEKLLAARAPIDGFGVGTSLGVSADRPGLDIAYKLASYMGKGRLKLSPGKPILPGRKQVFRREARGRFAGDVIARAKENLFGQPLLRPVMRNGRRLSSGQDDLESARRRAAKELSMLPRSLLGTRAAEKPYPVKVSSDLDAFRRKVESAVQFEG